MSLLILPILMVSLLITKDTSESTYHVVLINPWHSKTSTALNDFIISLSGCTFVIMKYVCQLSSLVVCVKVVLSHAYDTFCLLCDLISRLSLSCFETFNSTPADTAKS